MKVKGLECVTFSAYHTLRRTYCYSFSNTKEKIDWKKTKLNPPFVGCTIAFNVCNKPFKPLGIP